MQTGSIRIKLFKTVILFLICAALLVSATYAWLVLSRAPQIEGIDTNICSNGSLEIALLSDETHDDPDSIRFVVGNTIGTNGALLANLTWGNLIDLSDESYGLGSVSLRPSRLAITLGGSGEAFVSDNLLLIPDFGSDGRMTELRGNMLSAVYSEKAFTYTSGRQSYGVRGIGTYDGISNQSSALAIAKSSVRNSISGAKNTSGAAWQTNGEALMTILTEHYLVGKNIFTANDVGNVKAFLESELVSLNYIDTALRHGVVGIASSKIDNGANFNLLRTQILDTTVKLSDITKNMDLQLSEGISGWIDTLEKDIFDVRTAINTCNNMSDGATWAELMPLLRVAIDPDKVYFGDEKLSQISAGGGLPSDSTLSLAPGSGVMVDVADFAGNYSAFATFAGISVELKTVSAENPCHLENVYVVLEGLDTADGTPQPEQTELKEIYGYAIDLAFRCNAESPSLLLQTDQTQRIDPEDITSSTLGQGSFLKFSSEYLNDNSVVNLLDAVRIVFVDDMNCVLAVAKANTSNHEKDESGIKAPVYLYEYTVSGGALVMGKRLKDDNVITPLARNKAKIVTAIVMLDGDNVGNDMVSIMENSVTGTLNLEFASDVELIPNNQKISESVK